ncbi:DUF2852 domain-containing protein [Palleronia caenipelagi]|uniref:DUF2852 domain-containing protein n=1 Tax=Palleronia caenipelagi TaxID=2489174 RepID=A0A547PXM3_9RHOB|nr:DUF2852 domain-containing protein [Palleronia caenipelagi]TRD18895.1 DUF2852 domain-containing protein [Palleronia caenipelagi]
MTDFATNAPVAAGNVLRRAEDWLDQRGRGAWIAAMVLGFIFVWPVGLALLAFMVWQNKFAGRSCHAQTRIRTPRSTTGNAAFDAYRAETLRRLEEEQAAFEEFMQRLREARDKAEFDQFMEERQPRKDIAVEV